MKKLGVLLALLVLVSAFSGLGLAWEFEDPSELDDLEHTGGVTVDNGTLVIPSGNHVYFMENTSFSWYQVEIKAQVTGDWVYFVLLNGEKLGYGVVTNTNWKTARNGILIDDGRTSLPTTILSFTPGEYIITLEWDGSVIHEKVCAVSGSCGEKTYSPPSGWTAQGWLIDAGASTTVDYVRVYKNVTLTFNFRDILTGKSLSGVTVNDENGAVLGTFDDGGSISLVTYTGTHTFTFEKSGYWSVTKTVEVQGDTTVSVEMYPSSAAFKLENFPADISIPENTINELTFTLSPIQTSATYNTYLAISGLSDVLEVKKDGSAISPEGGKYYLGDVSGPTQVSIKFKAGAVGQHGFTLTLTSNDAIMSKTYTTTKQVTYQVEPLPFSVQMPSEWQVGTNELRISESSGQSYLITAVLKDSSGNEVWSDSHAFSPYEAHTFTVNVPSEGSYTLELQWNGQTAVYSIHVNPAITLVTKTLTVEKGGEGTIVLHFKNPSSNVQYYTVKVSGGFLPAEINQSISVAPLSEKDVSIAFAVPEDLTYDAYELQVQVLQGDSVVFSDKVAVSISEDGGFSLFGGSSSGGKTLYYGLAALVGLGLFIAILRRR